MDNLNIFVLIFVVSGGVLCAWAAKILWKHNLFRHPLVLLPCLIFMGGGFLAILLGLGMLEYAAAPADKPLATLYFSRQTGNQFSVRIKDYKGDEYFQQLEGEYWQLDARLIRFGQSLPLKADPLARLEHFYVLNRLSDNTVNIEQFIATPHREDNKIDSWQWLKKTPKLNRLVSFEMSRTMKQPLKHNTVYTVSLGARGLVAESVSLTTNSTSNTKRI